MTQNCTLLTYLSEHGPRTALEIFKDTTIPKYTGRISECRKKGIELYTGKDAFGHPRYDLPQDPETGLRMTLQTALEKLALRRVPTPRKADTPKSQPRPISAHKNEPGAELAAIRWAGHTPKRFKVAGREVTMKEYKAILAEKKQGSLL
jgi:hypothetical protein